MSIRKSNDHSVVIKVLMQNGIMDFKQQIMKDQIGQYLFMESNEKRLSPQARDGLKADMS